MRSLICGAAAIFMGAAIAVAPVKQARADGGATVVIIGGYLIADYIVGEECGYREWPFNILTKVTRTKPCYRKRDWRDRRRSSRR